AAKASCSSIARNRHSDSSASTCGSLTPSPALNDAAAAAITTATEARGEKICVGTEPNALATRAPSEAAISPDSTIADTTPGPIDEIDPAATAPYDTVVISDNSADSEAPRTSPQGSGTRSGR